LLHKLNALDYYKKPFPKSLGIEYVNEIVLPIMAHFDIPIKDKMRTFIEHIAIQTALAMPDKREKLLVTGGGAYNIYLIERLKFQAPQLKIIIPNKKTIEYKEALIFALLGVLKLRNEINVLSSVTGAKKDHSSGIILN
jgi:anhydro-N-acetylmuramic acid kinase